MDSKQACRYRVEKLFLFLASFFFRDLECFQPHTSQQPCRNPRILTTSAHIVSDCLSQIDMDNPAAPRDYIASCATENDIASIVSCTNDAYIADTFFKKDDYHNRFTYENVKEMISASNAIFLIAKESSSGIICGSLYLLWETSSPENNSERLRTVGKFSAVAVAQNFQKRGIGHMLISKAEEFIVNVASGEASKIEEAKMVESKRSHPHITREAEITMGVINLREDLFPWYEKQGFIIGKQMPWDAELARIVKEGYEHVSLIQMSKRLL